MLLLFGAIALVDIRYHKIPNIMLLPILIWSLLHLDPFITLIFMAISLSAYLFCGLGAGDVKLLSACASLMVNFDLSRYLFALTISALIQLSVESLIKRRWVERLPLAPSICVATIVNM